MKQKIILLLISITFFACTENNNSNNDNTLETNVVFIENFDGNNPKKLENFSYGTGRITPHDNLLKIEDGILKAAIDGNDKAGAWQGRNYAANELSLFGRYSARIKIPPVETQPNVGGVVGFYTYYSDLYGNEQEKDINQNGITDNPEIDFEWLIANPKIIYLTAWTDYEEKPNGTEFRKISRIINLATGKIYSTTYAEKWGKITKLTDVENQPETIKPIPNFDASKNFYTYGFDWKTDNIRWWIINPENSADTITLWDYKGNTERITQKPAYLSFNIWHTNDWAAEEKPKSTEIPIGAFFVEFDWIKYERFDRK